MDKVLVYRHRKLTNDEVFYVGIGMNDRPYQKRGRNDIWNKIVKKYGYRVEVVQECDSWELACELEQFLIQLYGRINNNTGQLSNMTDGGQGRYKSYPTEETRKKLSEWQIGKKLSDEHKKKIGEGQKGKLLPDEFKNQWAGENKRGEKSTSSKLKNEDVIWIRENYVSGCKVFGQQGMANKFGISRGQIYRIVHNMRWNHL